jgi:peptidoglycan/xylan/chitin deacetylase (PgdA/CDA1 family)
VNNYFDDLYSIQNRVKRITGEAPTLIRFPGGSSNEVSIRYDGGIKIMSVLTKEVENRGFQYYDWNISSGDAGGATTSNEVYNNVVSKLPGGYSIVLQHDTKKFSIDAVERIIQYGRANGYIFKPLTKDSPKSHHRVLN